MSQASDNEEDERQLQTQNGMNRINDADDCDVEEDPSDQPHRQNVTILQFQIGTPASPIATQRLVTQPAPNNPAPPSTLTSTVAASNVSDSVPTLSSIRASAIASLAHSIHVQVAKTDQPNIISIHVYVKVPLPTEKVKELLAEHLQAVASSDAGSSESTLAAPVQASSASTALSSALPIEKAPPPLTSIVKIVDNPAITSASSSSTSSVSSDQLPSNFATSLNSTLVRFSIPQYNFAKHNYLAASRHFFHSYSILTLIQEEYLGSSFSEDSLSALIEKAVEQSYQMWAKGERTSSNTALLSVLSSLKISWLCASSFLEEEVELSDLLFLTEEDIKSFVPKLGPRRRLMKWIQQQREERKMKQLQQEDEEEDEKIADAVGDNLRSSEALLSPSALSPSPSSSTPSAMAHSDGEAELSSIHQPEWSMSRSHADATHEESEHQTEQSELEADEEPSTHRKDDRSAAVEEGDEGEAEDDEEDESEDDGEDALNVTDATSDVTDAVSTLLDSPHVHTSDHTDHPATEASEVDRDHSDTEDEVLHRSDTSTDAAVESEEENEIGEKILPFHPSSRSTNQPNIAASASAVANSSSSSNAPVASTSAKSSHLRSSSSSVLDDSIEALSQPHEDDGYEGHDESDDHQTTHEDGDDEDEIVMTKTNSSKSKRASSDDNPPQQQQKVAASSSSSSSQSFKKESTLRKQRTKTRATAESDMIPAQQMSMQTATPVALPPGLAHYYTDESGHTIPMQLSQINGVLYAIPISDNNVPSNPTSTVGTSSSSLGSSSVARPIPILTIPAASQPAATSDSYQNSHD